jgi:hypothetical protein
VIVTLRGEGICRIISARKAERHEQDRYYTGDRERGEARTRGGTDWKRIDAMTDEEATANARDDPDAQPPSEERLAKMRRVSHLRRKVCRPRRAAPGNHQWRGRSSSTPGVSRAA